jgi:hypothetical protein
MSTKHVDATRELGHTTHPFMGLNLKRGLTASVLLVGIAWSYGAAAFLVADGSLTWSMPMREPHPARLHNLASYRFGPTLRASSYHRDEVSHHHPAFLIDGRAEPTLVEKWCSGSGDEAPWIEVAWNGPRRLSEVKIWHAGFRESAGDTIRRYRLSCISARQPARALQITSNTVPIATHALACSEASGVRIDWTPNVRGQRVRVYEIEAWGQ